MERYRKEEKSIKEKISLLKKKQLILAEATKNFLRFDPMLPIPFALVQIASTSLLIRRAASPQYGELGSK